MGKSLLKETGAGKCNYRLKADKIISVVYNHCF